MAYTMVLQGELVLQEVESMPKVGFTLTDTASETWMHNEHVRMALMTDTTTLNPMFDSRFNFISAGHRGAQHLSMKRHKNDSHLRSLHSAKSFPSVADMVALGSLTILQQSESTIRNTNQENVTCHKKIRPLRKDRTLVIPARLLQTGMMRPV